MGLASIRYVNTEADCFDDLRWALHNINHTAQECCGFALYDGKAISHEAHDDLVREFRPTKDLRGYCGIGNTSLNKDHQPRMFDHRRHGKYVVSFDGFLVNEQDLRETCDETFSTPHQVEVVAKLIGKGANITEGIENAMRRVVGAYTMAVMNEDGQMYIARDPLAIDPLIYGKNHKGFCIASESRALDKIGMNRGMRDFKPGEICLVDQFGLHTVKEAEGPSGRKRHHCSFLWGYFSSPDSVIDGIPVSLVRERCGAKLAEKESESFGWDDTIVSPVPDSGKRYAEGYAIQARLPYLEALLKYQYALKSYLRPTQEERQREADMKLNVIRDRVEGKNILLCEDSVRRGTQLRRTPIKLLRDAGAKSIHLRIGTPRNFAFCRFEERERPDEALVANQVESEERIAEYLGVDTLRYISEDDFVEALTEGSELERDDFCLGCYGSDFSFLGKKALRSVKEI